MLSIGAFFTIINIKIYWIENDESNINYSYKGKKVVNIVLKSEMTQLFWDFFFANDSVIIERREYILKNLKYKFCLRN